MEQASDLSRELEVACALAQEGGALVLRYHEARLLDPAALAVQMKAGDEPVTAADQAVNALLVAGLSAAFPGDALLTEELPDDGSRLGAARSWLVDPIDGTKDFIAGRPGFAVMIGLLREGQPALGVVYQPLGAVLYYAAAGQGAYRRRGGGPPERLRVSTVPALQSVRMASSASQPAPAVAGAQGPAEDEAIGSIGLRLSLIAAGERDLYANPAGRVKLWDTCAPEVILREAGGRLSDRRGAPLDYRGAELSHRRGLIASNGLVHEEAVERLRTLLP